MAIADFDPSTRVGKSKFCLQCDDGIKFKLETKDVTLDNHPELVKDLA